MFSVTFFLPFDVILHRVRLCWNLNDRITPHALKKFNLLKLFKFFFYKGRRTKLVKDKKNYKFLFEENFVF